MAGTNGGPAFDPNSTSHGSRRVRSTPASETLHDGDCSETDVAPIGDLADTSQALYIREFKKRLNGEGPKPAPQ